MNKTKKTSASLIALALATSTVAPYAAAQTYELRSVYAQIDGQTYVFPASDMADLLAQGKSVTHVEITTGHVFAIGDYSKELAKSKNKPMSAIFAKLIEDKKYLSESEITRLNASYDGQVETDGKDGDITVTVPKPPAPTIKPVVISDIITMRDVPNAVTIKFSKPPKNIEALITGEFIELEHNGEVFRLMYARSGVYDNEAIFRVVDGKRLHNNVSYNLTIAGDWAETTIKNVTIKNETPFVERIEGPSTVDASIVVNGKFDYAELRYVGVTQYGDTTELPTTTVLEKVVLDGKALATSDYTFRGSVLTLKNKLMPKSTIETTFSFKVKGRTERTTLTTTVNEFAPAEAARVELALDTTKPFYEGQDMTVKAKVFDQYGEEMKTAQVDWQVGSLQLTGGLTEKVTLQNSGSVVVTATVNGKTASQTITVLAAPKPAKIEVAVTPGNYFNGDDLPVTAKVFDQHGTEMRNQKVDWTVGDAKKLAGNQSDVLTLQNEGDVKITAKIGEVTGEQVVKVKPTPTLMKIESAPISFAADDTDAIYAPLVFTNTKDVEMKLNDVDITKLNADKGKLKYVKKKGTSYEEVTSNEATHIAVKIDPTSFTEGEHPLTVTSTQVQPKVDSVIKLTVTAPRQLAQLKMTPQSGVVGINDTLVIKVEPLDQYGKIMPKAILSAKSLDPNIIDLVSKDGQLFEAIEKNGKLSHYELTISGLKKGKTEVEISSGATKVKASFEVALSEIVKVTPKDSHTIDVTFNRSVSKLTRDMVEAITADGKTTLKAKSVVLSPDGMTATVVFRDRMAKNIDHKLKMVLGGEEDKVEHVYNYKVGAVKSIKMARQTVVQGRKVAYQVFDVNGVDITDDVTVTVNGTNAEHNFVTGQGFIRLAANATGSFTITINAERATTSAVITAESSVAAPRKIAEFWTLAKTSAVLLKADYEDVEFVQDTLVTTTTQDKYLQVSLRDQFSNDSELKDGMHLEYTSSADAVLRIDKLTGKLTPVANGRATITISLMDKDGAAVLDNEGKEIKKAITLAVKSVGVLNEIVLSTNQLQLINGVEGFKSQIVEVTGKDQYGETITIDPKDINLEIKGSPNDAAKLEVVKEDSKDGNKLTVTGNAAGSAEVVITYGGRMQTLYVHVEEPSKEAVGYKFFNVHDLYFVEEDGKPSTMTPTLYAVDQNNKPVKKSSAEIELDEKSVTALTAENLRKLGKTQFTLTATVDDKEIKETFNLIDNRKKPTVHVIDNYLKSKPESKPGKELSEVLLTQLALFDGHGKPIKEIKDIKFYSNNEQVIKSSVPTIETDATGTASITIESFKVTDSKGEDFVIDMDNEPFTLAIDTTPPEVKAITGTVKQQQAASLTHFSVIFTAVPQGVEGNDVELAIVQATNRDKEAVPTTVKVEGTKVTLSIGSKKVGDKIEVATKGEVVEALTKDAEASKLLTATTLDKDATASFTLKPAKLEDGKSAVNEVIITYSEALDPTLLGEFSLGGKPATKVTPSGDNDILILTFNEPEIIATNEIKLKTSDVTDSVGNELKGNDYEAIIKDGKLQLKN